MSGYIGVLPVPQTTQTRESFTATAGQTSFGTSGYQIDHLDVYLNGVKLAAADYTATNGSDIVLASGAAVNDILEMVAFETFTIANQSFTGTTTVDTLVVTNTVDGRDVSVDGAKLDTIPIISTSSTPSFTAKGDGTTDGYIQLNCSQNSHGIKLKSPPHSANASYTLTFPNDDGNAGQFLKTNGSGVLSWATDSTTDSTKLPLAGGAMTGPITTNSTFDGRDVATDGTKLDGIEASADVTDTTNVTAAGALMDSELTNLAAVKAINQSLVTTASPTFAGMATTANVTFGDNDKAVFGAGSDLQIYHTGTDSIIQEAVNNRRFLIGGDEIAIRKGDLSEDMAKFTADGAVELYHNNVKTFETTATGIDVTGTVSANGLIIEDGGSATNSLDITYSGSSGQANIQVDSNGGNTFLTFGTSQSGTVAERMRIDSSGNVGIGLSAPACALHIDAPDNGAIVAIFDTDNSSSKLIFRNTSTTGNNTQIGADGNDLVALTGGSERMRIDASGNIGLSNNAYIGTLSSAHAITVQGGAGSPGGSIRYGGGSGDNDLRFSTNGSEHMRISNGGIVGIGTSNPATDAKLVVSNGGAQGFEVRANSSRIEHLHYNRSAGAYMPVRNNGLSYEWFLQNGSAMALDSSGAVTMPLQPAFQANVASTVNNLSTSSATTIAFGTQVFDQNSDYNTNGTFTAPVAGKYQLNVSLRLENIDSAAAYYQISIVTSNRSYRYIFDPDFGQDNAYFSPSISILADMDASDTAHVIISQSSGTAQTDIHPEAYFSGYLAC